MKQKILYIIAGISTTLINTIVFMGMIVFVHPLIANILAWIFAVIWAYFANAKFVFHHSLNKNTFLRFCALRLATLGMECMLLGISLQLGSAPLIAKMSIASIVVIANYFWCRIRIFQKEDQHESLNDHRSVFQ